MATDPIRMYLDTRKVFERATGQAEQIVGVITDAAEKLKKWRNVMVAKVSAQFPGELLSAPLINGQHWPTAEQLAEALVGWHNAYRAMRDAWSAIPVSDKRGLQAPPEYR